MLNELYGLSSTLHDMKINTKEWHREYNPLPAVKKNAPCFRIWLSDDGSIRNIEELNAELVQTLRKFGNNQRSFPAFNIASLYRIIDKQQISYLERVENDHSLLDLDEIKSWCVDDNWRSSIIRKINNSLHKTALHLLGIINEQHVGEYSAVPALIELADSFSNNGDGSFRSALEACVFEKLEKGEGVNTALTVLFHKGNPASKDPERDSGTLSVILDLFDWRQYGHPIASEYTTGLINDILLKSDRLDGNPMPADGEIDAFGTPFSTVGEPMPSVRLKGFNVTLRSMFNGQPCQYRYGRIDDASYPVAKPNRSLAKESLEWISQGDKEGLTWRQADKNEIVFVYPSKLPAVPLKFASLFGAPQGNDGKQTAARFEHLAQELTKTLKGIPPQNKPDNIQIFSIRKMDKARTKIVFTRNCSLEWFTRSAESWQSGCRNFPDMEFTQRIIPFPLQVANIVNKVWKQNGELANQGKATVKKMQYYQGMELLLDPVQDSIIRYYLSVLLLHSSGLVKYVGGVQHSRPSDQKEELVNNEKEIALIMPVFGLLLDKCGHKKEDYVENTAYLIGQILKISDELHALYCNIVRGGDIPPQLVGNSMFLTASETPIQALAQLSTRMNPYISWAKQYRTKSIKDKGKESWRAGWYLSLYEDTANKLLSVLTDSTRFDDFGKAQVFIGYLAAFPKKTKHLTEDVSTENNTNTEEGDYNGQGS